MSVYEDDDNLILPAIHIQRPKYVLKADSCD